MCGPALAVGLVCAMLVVVGNAAHWPGFNSREGFWGTHFLAPLLYALGGNKALVLVAGIWFLYGFVPTILISAIIIGTARQRAKSKLPPPFATPTAPPAKPSAAESPDRDRPPPNAV